MKKINETNRMGIPEAYAVYDMDKSDLFNRRLKWDNDLNSLARNKAYALPWRKIAGVAEYSYYALPLIPLICGIAQQYFDIPKLPEEGSEFLAILAGLTSISSAPISLNLARKFRKAKEEYARRVDLLELRLNELQESNKIQTRAAVEAEKPLHLEGGMIKNE